MKINKKLATSAVCKNVVKEFVTIVLLKIVCIFSIIICIIPITIHMLGKIRIINCYMHIKSLHLLEIY